METITRGVHPRQNYSETPGTPSNFEGQSVVFYVMNYTVTIARSFTEESFLLGSRKQQTIKNQSTRQNPKKAKCEPYQNPRPLLQLLPEFLNDSELPHHVRAAKNGRIEENRSTCFPQRLSMIHLNLFGLVIGLSYQQGTNVGPFRPLNSL